MIKDKQNNNPKQQCSVHVMPSPISDEDINALFAGIVSIMKRKIELETKAQIINTQSYCEKLLAELKTKQAECNRLKNEILHLKSLIANSENITKNF